MALVRRDDMVEVIAGNDRGKRGKVLRVIPDRKRVVVQGVGLRWRHMRKSQKHPQGGRVRREMSIHISNVMVFDETEGSRTRLGVAVIDGKKRRINQKTGKRLGALAQGKKSERAEKPAKKKATRKKAVKKVKESS